MSSLVFVNRTYIENWLKNWLESYFRLLDEYKINTVTTWEGVRIHQDFDTDNFSFVYRYKTEEGRSVRIIYNISEYWIEYREGDISIPINSKVSDLIQFASDSGSIMSAPRQKKLKQYATLFYQKTEKYLKKTDRIMLGDSIITKFIRRRADNLNPKEQILLNKSVLLSCELDDLLK